VAALEERHDQLTKLDAEVDQYVQDACSQGRASPACQDANALAQGLQDSYNDYLGRLTYKELNREDYAQVSQIVANTSADKWDYAIEGYAKSQNISYQEAKDRFALAININQAADIAGIFYGLKGNEGGKTGISSAAASTLKQLMTKYDEFKQNIVSSTKGNNDRLITATPGAGYAGSEGSEVSSSAHLSVGAGGKGNTQQMPMLGQNGVQTSSKTIWKGVGKERIDVENPNPGQRPGQVHYQDNKNNKYYYDPHNNSFYSFDPAKNKIPAPSSVNNLLDDPKFKQAIDKGIKQYLGEK